MKPVLVFLRIPKDKSYPHLSKSIHIAPMESEIPVWIQLCFSLSFWASHHERHIPMLMTLTEWDFQSLLFLGLLVSQMESPHLGSEHTNTTLQVPVESPTDAWSSQHKLGSAGVPSAALPQGPCTGCRAAEGEPPSLSYYQFDTQVNEAICNSLSL